MKPPRRLSPTTLTTWPPVCASVGGKNRGRRYRVPARTLASFVRHKPNGLVIAIDAPGGAPAPARVRVSARSRHRG
jgi:hypothetical protein